MDGICGVNIVNETGDERRARQGFVQTNFSAEPKDLPVNPVDPKVLEVENEKAFQQQFEQLQAKTEMVTQRSWESFRDTGLLLIVNQILHVFGWAIVLEMADPASGHVTNVYPARVKFRGFDSSSVERAYQKVGKYLAENSKELYDEANYKED